MTPRRVFCVLSSFKGKLLMAMCFCFFVSSFLLFAVFKHRCRQMTGVRLEELRGILWPLDVYKRVKTEKPPKSMAIHTIQYCGRAVRGVLLDETHGRPCGTITVYGEDRRFVNKDCRSSGRSFFFHYGYFGAFWMQSPSTVKTSVQLMCCLFFQNYLMIAP